MASVARLSKLDAAREEGNRLVSKGEYARAVSKYTEALKLDNKHAKLYSNRSFAQFKMGRYALAKQDAELAIKADPGWNKGYFRLGEVLATTENFGRAEAIYAKGLSLDPADRLMRQRHKDAATAYAKQRDFEEREPMLFGFAAVVCAALVLYGDAYHSKAPMLQNNVMMGLTVVLCIGAGLALQWAKQMYKEMNRESYLLQTDLSPNYQRAASSPPFPGGPIPQPEGGPPPPKPGGVKKPRVFRKVPKKPPGVGARKPAASS